VKGQRRAAKGAVATYGIAARAAARADRLEPVWTIPLLRHPIEVKLKNRRGTVQARRGYWRCPAARSI
jgi:hypothetical protein